MGETNNLNNKEAIAKLKELSEDIKTCVFTTKLDTLPLSARPMYTKKCDEEGNLWFLTTKDGDHYSEITDDDRVQLFYSKPGVSEFLSVYGKAEFVDDKNKQDELYSELDKAWFDGKDDPKIQTVKVKPHEAYYWDTKHGRVVSLLKIAKSAMTNNNDDDGVKGKLNV